MPTRDNRDAADIANLPILVRCRCKCGDVKYWAPQMLRWGVKHLGCIGGGVYIQVPEEKRDDPRSDEAGDADARKDREARGRPDGPR